MLLAVPRSPAFHICGNKKLMSGILKTKFINEVDASVAEFQNFHIAMKGWGNYNFAGEHFCRYFANL